MYLGVPTNVVNLFTRLTGRKKARQLRQCLVKRTRRVNGPGLARCVSQAGYFHRAGGW